jgi:hypothetical protein
LIPAAKTIVVPKQYKRTLQLYTPHEIQEKLHASYSRYRVACWGRQSGKSTWGNNELLKRAWENPNTSYWFVSPTFDQAKIQYRRLVGMLSPCWDILKKKNQTELRVKLINNSQIVFKSGEVLHNLRGETLHGCIIDEYRDQHPDLWKQVLQPMLRTTKGWAAFLSTPDGFDDFYELHARAKSDASGRWGAFNAPSTCNPLFDDEEFQDAKREMSDLEFRQEILAEFVNLTQGQAYFSFGDWNLCVGNRFAPKGQRCNAFLPIELYMDFNVRPMSWTIAQFREGHGHHFLDEIYIENRSNTEEAAKEFVDRFKSYGIRAPTQVILVGDASGGATKTSAKGDTDFTIVKTVLTEAGITFDDRTPESNPGVKDRVNTVNARLKSASGSVQITFDPQHCPNTVKDMQKVVWKKGSGAILDQTSDPMRTHLSDSVGYGVCVRNPLLEFGDVGGLSMVRRK